MAIINNLKQGRLFDNLFVRNKQKILSQTLGATLVLTTNMPNRLLLDPGGSARAVTLPAVAADLWFEITNTADAQENLTVSNAGGTVIATIGMGQTVQFFCDGSTWFSAFDGGAIIPVTAATLTLTRGQHGGHVLALDAAGGIDLTLPAALGTGERYDFIVKTATTDAYTFTRAGSDTIAGQVLADDGDGEPANGFSTASCTVVSLGGASQATGGTVGDRGTFIDYAAAKWQVSIWATQGGTEATPFA